MLFCYIFAMWFIVSQVAGGIALVLSAISYFASNKKYYLFFQIAMNIFYALSFIVINALVAGIDTIVFIFLTIIVYFYEKNSKKTPIIFLILFSAFYIIIGIVFLQDYLEIIPICTSIIFTAVIWIKEMHTLRYFLLIPNIMLVIYGIACGVYTTALLDFLDTIMLVLAIVTWHLKNRGLKNKDLL